MPFRNLTGDTANNYVTDGVTEELNNALWQLGGVQVRGRISSDWIARQKLSAREIGKLLNAQYVVDGSLRRVGSEVRFMAQLVRVADGSELWSQPYDRLLTDRNLLAMQGELADKIAEALRLKLKQGTAIMAVRHNNPQAHEQYLKGRYALEHKTPTS